jgi:nucleosome binding factor SPN SPT16 subunit
MDTNVNAQMEYDDSQLISVNIDDGVVMLPMFGGRVPVPITAVRNVSYTPVDGDYAYLRINLLFPGSNVGGKPGGGEAAKFPHPEANFIKEM